MNKNRKNPTRRNVLKGIGTGAAALTATGLSGTTAGQSLPYKTLRGTIQDPISIDEIKSIRKSFANKHSQTERGEPNHAFLDPSDPFGDGLIIGYNVLPTDGTPKEQYVAMPNPSTRASEGTISTESTTRPKSTNERLHQKADELLTRELQTAQTDTITTSSTYDIDWSDWYSFGSTDVYYQGFDGDADYNTKPGNVEFTIDIRRSSDNPRIGARSKIRMEPGRQVCNAGYSDYCTDEVVQTGWRNRHAIVYHDWDQNVNNTPTDDLIVGTDPAGQVDDITTTRTATLSLNIAEDPSLTLGYSSSVSFPAAVLIDKTTKKTGRSKHKFQVNSPTSYSSKNNAVFEVGSAAKYQTNCGDFYKQQYFEFTADFMWSLKNVAPLIDWVNEEKQSKSFSYYTYC